jgi:hypothetical protein
VAHVKGKRNTYRALVEKTDGKRSLVRHRHRQEDNKKMDCRYTGCTE